MSGRSGSSDQSLFTPCPMRLSSLRSPRRAHFVNGVLTVGVRGGMAWNLGTERQLKAPKGDNDVPKERPYEELPTGDRRSDYGGVRLRGVKRTERRRGERESGWMHKP